MSKAPPGLALRKPPLAWAGDSWDVLRPPWGSFAVLCEPGDVPASLTLSIVFREVGVTPTLQVKG